MLSCCWWRCARGAGNNFGLMLAGASTSGCSWSKGRCSLLHFNLVCAPQFAEPYELIDDKVAPKHIGYADKVGSSSQWYTPRVGDVDVVSSAWVTRSKCQWPVSYPVSPCGRCGVGTVGEPCQRAMQSAACFPPATCLYTLLNLGS